MYIFEHSYTPTSKPLSQLVQIFTRNLSPFFAAFPTLGQATLYLPPHNNNHSIPARLQPFVVLKV